MPQLPGPIIKERAARLRAAADAALAAELSARIGSETDVLIERPGIGRAAFYAAVSFTTSGTEGSVRRMHLVGSNGRNLIGKPIQ